jgi:hypothetical protein
LSSHYNAMLISYYVCIYIIKRAVEYVDKPSKKKNMTASSWVG